MLPLHPLATALQADREHEIRGRVPKPVGVPSGRRRPAMALSVELPRPRVAPVGQGQT